MFATTHALTGIVISRVTPSAPAILGLTLLSHIVLDIVPHGDNILMDNNHKKRLGKVRKFFPFALGDISILTVLVIYLFKNNFPDPYLTLLAVFSSIFFDLVSVAFKLTGWKFLKSFEYMHQWLHYLIAKHLPKKDISPSLSTGLQIIFVIVVLRALKI